MTNKNKSNRHNRFKFFRKKAKNKVQKKVVKKVVKKVEKKKFGLFKFLNWQNISIGNKYITSFSVAAILFFLSGLIVHTQLSSVEKNVTQLESDSQLTFDMMQMSSLIQLKDMQMADYIITKSEKYVTEYEAYHEEFIELENKLKPLMHTDEQKSTRLNSSH